MNIMQGIFKDARRQKPVDDQVLESLSHFEIRPIYDGHEHVMTTGITNDDENSNTIQVRMGVIGRPTELIALNNICDTRQAFIDFYQLRKFEKRLFYDGIEIGCELKSCEDFVQQLIESERVKDTPGDVTEACALVGMMPQACDAFIKGRFSKVCALSSHSETVPHVGDLLSPDETSGSLDSLLSFGFKRSELE